MVRSVWVGWPRWLLLLIGLVGADYVGQTVTGDVAEGNYTYYSLRQNGKVRLELNTISGDADLYVSSLNERPSYHNDEYELLSATCGEDLVTITADIPRPVHIAVYGHPRHSSSEYILDVIVVEEEEYDYFKPDDTYFLSDEEKSEKERVRRDRDEHGREEASNGKVFWKILWQILEIIIDVLN